MRSRDYLEQSALDPEAIDIDAAYHFFLVSWMGRNGVAGTKRYNCAMAVRWTPGGGGSGGRFCAAVESLPDWHERLRSVLILKRDALDVIPRIDDLPSVAIYVDPPYFSSTRSGSTTYEHDFSDADAEDGERREKEKHERLAKCLGRFQRARVVVSYYDDPRLAELYPGWTRRDMARQKNLHVQNRRGAGSCIAPEVLLLNGPSLAQAAAEPRLFD